MWALFSRIRISIFLDELPTLAYLYAPAITPIEHNFSVGCPYESKLPRF
jgi:hypothetical protein